MFPAFFSCSNNFTLLQSSSESADKNISIELSEPTVAGDLSKFIGVLSRVDFHLDLLHRTAFLLQTHTLSDKLAKLVIIVSVSYHFQKISFQFKYFTRITKC